MSLTKKLLSSFAAMLGLVLLLGAVGLLVTHDLSGDLERAANVTARQQYLAGQVSVPEEPWGENGDLAGPDGVRDGDLQCHARRVQQPGEERGVAVPDDPAEHQPASPEHL